jgi:DNA methylase
MKPEALVRRPIEHASFPGEVVCDPFMGSGTTCAVAKTLGRGYIGIELDPQFFSLAATRIAAAGVPFAAGDDCRASRRTPPRARRLRSHRAALRKKSE